MMALLLSLVAMLPFIHDIITIKGEGIKGWVPNLGIKNALTYMNAEGKEKVHSFSSYRTFLYFLFLHIFAAIGWAGWAKDARPGRPYKFFLLVPAILTIYTVMVIIFNARDSNFNEATTKIFLIIAVNFLVMFYFLYHYFRQKD